MAEQKDGMTRRDSDRLSEDDGAARRLHERREKERRDNAMYLRDAYKRGYEEGLKIGLEEGRKKGFEEGLMEWREQAAKNTVIEIAGRLLKIRYPLELIMEVTELSAEEVGRLN